jgi:hypothetical protein
MTKKRSSAYLIYSQEVRPKLKAEDPSLGFGELAQKIGQLWKSLPEAEKAPYFEKAKAKKAFIKRKAQ